MATTQSNPNDLARMFTMHNLIRAWESVSMKNAAAGIDGVTVDAFARNWRDQLTRLQGEILGGAYRPQPYIVFPKAKKNGGVRELVNGTVRDKIVARVAADEMTFRHDRDLLPQSYAYRPHRGALKAVSAVERHYGKASHALRADIEDFFDTLDHQLLHARLCRMGEAPSMADFLLRCTAVDRFDGVSKRRMDAGVPQGSALAPILSNIYLHPLDEALNEAHYHFVRYADDILVLAGHPDQANGALGLIQEQLDHLRLHLSIDKTRVHSVDGGFVFLGFLFGPNGKTACQEARRHLHEMMESPRYTDETEDEYLIRLESMRRGWKNYYGAETPVAGEGVIDVPSTPVSENDDRAPAIDDQTATEAEVESDTTDAAGSSASRRDELRAAREQFQRGLINEAVCRLRRLLNDDEAPLEPSFRRDAAGLLADIYDRRGLTGAARRCRQAAGIATGGAQAEVATPEFGPREIDEWLALFGQGDGVVARQYVDTSGRHGYRPASEKLGRTYLRDHWAGRHTLAVPVYLAGDKVHFAVLDLDVTKRVAETLDRDGLAALRRQLLDDAVGLLDVAHRAGVDGVIEDSGCKGYHVWFFFYEPLTATLARRFMATLCQVAGLPPEGAHRELFPNSDTRPPDGAGSRIKLPMGIHRLTERRCDFRLADGGECGVVEQFAMLRIRNRAGQLKKALMGWNQWQESATDPQSPPAVEPATASTQGKIAQLEARCAVLRALEIKAAKTHDLSHYERMVVRGVLAPLGAEGVARVHAILRGLDNYNYSVTERMLRSAPPHPISCARIKEILGTFADEAGCGCAFKPRKGQYAHPLRHLAESVKNNPSPKTDDSVESASTRAETANRPRRRASSEAAEGRSAEMDDGDLAALLKAYRAARRDLLDLQAKLEARCGADGCVETALGTLRADGPDRVLKHWAIEI